MNLALGASAAAAAVTAASVAFFMAAATSEGDLKSFSAGNSS